MGSDRAEGNGYALTIKSLTTYKERVGIYLMGKSSAELNKSLKSSGKVPPSSNFAKMS
jgi:hypothetical protein